MNTPHTPGPWLDWETLEWLVEPKHLMANTEDARLIAAAPDLLAALKDAMRSSRKDFKHGPDGERQHREAYAEQFAAIAKAEGQS